MYSQYTDHLVDCRHAAAGSQLAHPSTRMVVATTAMVRRANSRQSSLLASTVLYCSPICTNAWPLLQLPAAVCLLHACWGELTARDE
jgi:hypothetical protein